MRRFLIFVVLFFLVFLGACSTDSTATNPDSSDLNGDARYPSIEELPKNLDLGVFLGAKMMLVSGPNSLFSLWFFEEGESFSSDYYLSRLVFSSDFDNATLIVDESALGAYQGTPIATAIKDQINSKGIRIHFVYQDSTLFFSVDKGKLQEIKLASVELDPGVLSKADVLPSNRVSCSPTDSENGFDLEFFANGYYLKMDKVNPIHWSVGHYDVHRSRLFLYPLTSIASTMQLNSYKVSSDLSQWGDFSCETNPMETIKVNKKDLSKNWNAMDSLEWRLGLSSSEFTLRARSKKEEVEYRSGNWLMLEDYLVLQTMTCSDPATCARASLLKVLNLDSDSLFIKQLDTSTPMIATRWSEVAYE